MSKINNIFYVYLFSINARNNKIFQEKACLSILLVIIIYILRPFT